MVSSPSPTWSKHEGSSAKESHSQKEEDWIWGKQVQKMSTREGFVSYSLEILWRSLFIQPAHTVKAGGGMEISQVPAFE